MEPFLLTIKMLPRLFGLSGITIVDHASVHSFFFCVLYPSVKYRSLRYSLVC